MLTTFPLELFQLIVSACGIEQLRTVTALAATNSKLASMVEPYIFNITFLKSAPFDIWKGQCSMLKGVRFLSLNDKQICDTTVAALARALSIGALVKLEALFLGSNQIGDIGVKTLVAACASGALANLKRLCLGKNKIGDAGVIS